MGTSLCACGEVQEGTARQRGTRGQMCIVDVVCARGPPAVDSRTAARALKATVAYRKDDGRGPLRVHSALPLYPPPQGRGRRVGEVTGLKGGGPGLCTPPCYAICIGGGDL
uniref:Uncharacterized protein n=1 Tax=Eutreptiella gymnastica TaxID=73025 RepID=A0A7S4FR49_9EUGL